MSTKAAHTDLPWYSMIAGTSEGKEYFEISGTNSIYWVAKVRYQFAGNSSTEQELANGRANADLIITAVNHHQELITRLYNLVNAFECNIKAADLRIEEARETLKKVMQ